jgi:hypothetical protein
LDVYTAFEPKDAVPSLLLTELSRKPGTTQIREASLRIIGKLMPFTTKNRDPLHSGTTFRISHSAELSLQGGRG